MIGLAITVWPTIGRYQPHDRNIRPAICHSTVYGVWRSKKQSRTHQNHFHPDPRAGRAAQSAQYITKQTAGSV